MGSPPDRRPLADIRPSDIRCQHYRPVRPLHHRIIDRDLRSLGEELVVEHDEAEVLFRSRHRRNGRHREFRLETLDLLQHDVGAKDEIAGVPEITVFDERARTRLVGFLHESLDPAYMGIERERRARMNVAVAGGGMVGRDPERRFRPRWRLRTLARKEGRIVFRPRTHGRRRVRRRPSSGRWPPPRRPRRRRLRRYRADQARAGSPPRRRFPSIARRPGTDTRYS